MTTSTVTTSTRTTTTTKRESSSPADRAIPEFSLAERDRRWNIGRRIMDEMDLEGLVIFGSREGAFPAPLSRRRGSARGLHIDVYRWEQDGYTAFHPDGYQGGVLDRILNIDEADIVVAIFWARLGTPDPKLGGKTGSQHELDAALEVHDELWSTRAPDPSRPILVTGAQRRGRRASSGTFP